MNKDDKCIKLQWNILRRLKWKRKLTKKICDAILQVKEQEAVISSMTSEMSESKDLIKEREKEFSSCNKGTLLAHLSWKLKWAFLSPVVCRLSVRL